MKPIALIALTLLLSGFGDDGAWVVDPQSKLAIHGSTNVNTFTCQIASYTGHDTLYFYNTTKSGELRFIKNRMSVPVQGFDCGSRLISRDFRSILQAERYPNLSIRFISLTGAPKHDVKALVEITLAGVTRIYRIHFDMKSDQTGVFLKGNHPVNFSDFNLTAPQKLKGMIRVKNSLDVEFNLVLKAI